MNAFDEKCIFMHSGIGLPKFDALNRKLKKAKRLPPGSTQRRYNLIDNLDLTCSNQITINYKLTI